MVDTQDPCYITPFVEERVLSIVAMYGNMQQAILPIISIFYREYGKLGDGHIALISRYTKLPVAAIKRTIDFYYPAHRQATGRCKIIICINFTCALKQSKEIVDFVCSYLDIKPGTTTPDGRFSLLTAHCLGGCSKPPTVRVNSSTYQEMDKYKMKKVLDELE